MQALEQATLGKNCEKISGNFCIYPKNFPFFFSKWENFGRNTKCSRTFSMIFLSASGANGISYLFVRVF